MGPRTGEVISETSINNDRSVSKLMTAVKYSLFIVCSHWWLYMQRNQADLESIGLETNPTTTISKNSLEHFADRPKLW